jgi:hypothetical protein
MSAGGGWVAIPREMMAVARKLRREQGWLLLELAFGAQFGEPGEEDVRGHAVRIDLGEILWK